MAKSEEICSYVFLSSLIIKSVLDATIIFLSFDPLFIVGCFYYICKVEFIQPSNWLYSVPNLLVIQHLVTLYLGGFDVRVVSEIE